MNNQNLTEQGGSSAGGKPMITHNGTTDAHIEGALLASIDIAKNGKQQNETRQQGPNPTTALTPVLTRAEQTTQQNQITARFLPALSIQQAIERRQAIADLMKHNVLRAGVDYGIIPGTAKPTLLKPGAERICSYFGLAPSYATLSEDLDWTGRDHNGEPFFYTKYKCSLLRDGFLMAEGDGSSNSWEVKHRYRMGERHCPQCGVAAIIPGKAEYGGGWLCFRKKGGCGFKFEADHQGITSQTVGRVPNTDVADLVNTIQKMSQKRALIAATLNATNASEFFTQDMEDSTPEIETHPNAQPPVIWDARPQAVAAPIQPEPTPKPPASETAAPWRNRGEMRTAFAKRREEVDDMDYHETMESFGVNDVEDFIKLPDGKERAIKCMAALNQLSYGDKKQGVA